MNGQLPSGQIAKAALQGDAGAWVSSGLWTLRRAALLWLGMTAAGDRQHTVAKALAGSAAVQAVVLGWVALSKDPTLPSGEAAVQADLTAILTTYAARAGVIALGLHLAGHDDKLWRNALAGAAAIEISVLVWAAQQRKKPALPDYIVG